LFVNKAKANYWIDVGIGIAGLLSALSGLVFLLPGEPTTGILGISYQAWNRLHTWSSLAAIAGVVAHMALHWKWMVSMTRQMLSPKQEHSASARVPEPVSSGTAPTAFSRRAFLLYGGTAAVAVAATVAGLKAVFDVDTAEASPTGSQSTVTGQQGGVACPFGLVSDPFPGRCRWYVDTDGDGICDYSVPGSGDNVAFDGERGGFRGGFQRPGFRQP
jgi:hypothetical protein